MELQVSLWERLSGIILNYEQDLLWVEYPGLCRMETGSQERACICSL